ncbi:MAG: DUF4382 domain-containing protein [Planctomycetota bacterium]
MQRTLRQLLFATSLAAASLLSACTEGGSGSGGADPTLTFAITDSASDDIESFTVEVTQIRLLKLGGALVDVLTTPATIDLATLTDASQILSVGNVPVGTYLSADITLDFTNAECMLVGQSTPATLLDVDGNPLTGTVVLPIHFGTDRLICPVNRHKLLEFDFDLNQSVTTDTVGNSATVEPAFVMHVDPAAPKPLLAVGTLVSVDTVASTFDMEIRTFGGTLLNTATFQSDATTLWHIDGVSSLGAAGLTSLAAAAPGTWVQLAATHDPLLPLFDAIYVEAGAGTYNGGDDIVDGHIVDRVGGAGTDPILTVLGYSSNAAHTVFQFNTSFTVSASFPNTKVVRTAVDQAFDTDDLNVGQRVRIFGTLTGVTMDATSATSVVRMQITRVLGFATGAPAGGVQTIDIARVDLRPETDFNWPGGGPTPPDPNAFDIQVGALGTGLGIVATTPVEARGFFPAFDDAAEDFQAASLTNRATAPSLMLVRNRPAGMTVAVTANPTQIVVALSGVPTLGEFAVIDAGFVGVQNLPTSPAPGLIPSLTGPRFYVVRDKSLNTAKLFVTFAAFSAEVANLVALGADVAQVAGIGRYNSGTNQIEAQLASVVVE